MAKFFGAIREKANRIKKIDQRVVINTILRRKEFQNFIIFLNTESQLFELNIDIHGVSLAANRSGYSDFTLALGKKRGRNRVDLKDTGEYYDSHKVTISSLKADFFTMDSDPFKDDNNLFDEWGEILGLTRQSLDILAEKILEEIFPILIKEI